MNYCPNCGTANRDGSRFCNDCGHKLPSKTGIVCPMCSHINPAANVYCDNCQARLVPAAPGSSPLSEPPPPGSGAAPIKGLSLPTKPAEESGPPEVESPPDMDSSARPEADETPDWLVRLRAAAPRPSEQEIDTPAPTQPVAEEPASADEIPDWMRPGEGETPDWFQRIAEPARPAEPASQPSAEDGLSDWLEGIRDRPEPSAPAGAEPAAFESPEARDAASAAEAERPAQQIADTDLPDWLKDIGEETAPPAETPPAEAISAEEAPDWLADLRAQPEAETPSDEVPDWLSGMSDQAQVEEAPPAETPDWLAGTREEPRVEEPVEEAPDWLADLRAQPEAETPSDEVPDWLSGMSDQAQVEEAPTAETPNWLAGTREEPRVEESVEEAPDWLADLRAQPEAETPSDEVPDWLSGVSDQAQVEEAPTAETPEWLDRLADTTAAEAPAGEDEVPDWLRVDSAEAPPVSGEAAAPPAGPVSAFIGDETELADTGETPDWLTDVSQPPPPASDQQVAPAEVPEWLRDLGPMPSLPQPEGAPFGEVPQATPGEVPEWLREMQPGQAPPAFADEAGRSLVSELDRVADAGLEAAAIPSWLQALRPTDIAAGAAAMPEESTAETEGLLANLENVLPAADFMGKPQGVPARRQVQIPAADLARAGLFQELLARGSLAPTVVKPGQEYRTRVRARVGRWALAIVFLFAAFLPSTSDFMASVFQLGNAEALFKPAAEQIDTLSAGQRVLVAFDYDPFQAGEMDPIAEAFLTHIWQRDAAAVIVSLSPTGPALANRVVNDLAEVGAIDTAIVQPRYFPGQAVGAQSVLASNPADLIVVLAGSPEAMRWWIEQVSVSGAQTPIVAGVSAGVLPQILPYAQSGQVAAVVEGMMGGLAYQRSIDPDQDSGSDGVGRIVRSEALYLLQMIFAVVLIIGLIFSLAAGMRRAR